MAPDLLTYILSLDGKGKFEAYIDPEGYLNYTEPPLCTRDHSTWNRYPESFRMHEENWASMAPEDLPRFILSTSNPLMRYVAEQYLLGVST